MKLEAPPYGEIAVISSDEADSVLDSRKLAAFAEAWPESWPAYREILQELFSDYDHEDSAFRSMTLALLGTSSRRDERSFMRSQHSDQWPNQDAAANRRPAGPLDGSDN